MHEFDKPSAALPDVADGLLTHAINGANLGSTKCWIRLFDIKYLNNLFDGKDGAGLAGLDGRHYFELLRGRHWDLCFEIFADQSRNDFR